MDDLYALLSAYARLGCLGVYKKHKILPITGVCHMTYVYVPLLSLAKASRSLHLRKLMA